MRRQNSSSGFTLIEIMTAVAIIGVLSSVAIPGISHSRVESRKGVCINNLRILDNATEQWALENNRAESEVPVDADIQPYVNDWVRLYCPEDETRTFASSYTLAAAEDDPACQINPAEHALT